MLYHHAPSHTDEQMDQIAATYLAKGAAIGIEVLTSFEGMTLPIGAGGDVKIRFWGVRGSFAMSGREFLRYGGNTTLDRAASPTPASACSSISAPARPSSRSS